MNKLMFAKGGLFLFSDKNSVIEITTLLYNWVNNSYLFFGLHPQRERERVRNVFVIAPTPPPPHKVQGHPLFNLKHLYSAPGFQICVLQSLSANTQMTVII